MKSDNPYTSNKVARCQLDRIFKEDSILRTMIGMGQLKTPLSKERGFFLLRGKYIPESNYKGLTKDAEVAMEKEWVKDEVFGLIEDWVEKYENDSEDFQNFAEIIRMD